jgi:hypothetical protein
LDKRITKFISDIEKFGALGLPQKTPIFEHCCFINDAQLHLGRTIGFMGNVTELRYLNLSIFLQCPSEKSNLDSMAKLGSFFLLLPRPPLLLSF